MPRTRRTLRTAPLLLAAAALALGACSDDGGLDPDEEAELLEEAIITEDDLPDGFTEGDPGEDDEEDFEDCLEEVDVDPDALDDATVAEEGPVSFDRESEETFESVEAELRSIDDTGVVDDLIEAMGAEDFQDCLLESAEADAEADDAEVDAVDLEEIDAAVDGDASIGLRFTAEFAGSEITSELHVVLVGDHLIRVEASSFGADLDDDLAEDAFDAMIERLEEAS